MGYFDRETKRIQLVSDPTLWAEIYSLLTWGELRQFDIGPDGSLVISLEKALPMLLVDWGFEKDGQKVPLDEEHINLLKKPDIEAIIAAVNGVISDSTDLNDNTKKKTSPKESPTS